jgi:hypothetical protein
MSGEANLERGGLRPFHPKPLACFLTHQSHGETDEKTTQGLFSWLIFGLVMSIVQDTPQTQGEWQMKQKGLVPTADAIGDLTHDRNRESAMLLVSIPMALALGIREAAESLVENPVLEGGDYLPDLSCGISIESANQLSLADVVAVVLMDGDLSSEELEVCIVGPELIAWPGSRAFDLVYGPDQFVGDEYSVPHWQTLNQVAGRPPRTGGSKRTHQSGTSHRKHRKSR